MTGSGIAGQRRSGAASRGLAMHRAETFIRGKERGPRLAVLHEDKSRDV